MRLSDSQVREFREQGVLVAEGVVTDEDLAPLIAEYEAWIDRRARALQAEGKIRDLRSGEVYQARNQMVRTCIHSAEGPIELDL